MDLGIDRSPSLSDLLERVRDGDDQAFDQFMRQNSKRVFAIVSQIIRNRGDAEDIVQEVFLRIYDRRGDIRIETAQVWMLRIAVNCAYDRLRKKKREPILETDLADSDDDRGNYLARAPSDAPNAEAIMLDVEQVSRLTVCLEALPARQRACLQLKYFERMDQKDIAGILGTSDPTISRELRRANEALRECLGARTP